MNKFETLSYPYLFCGQYLGATQTGNRLATVIRLHDNIVNGIYGGQPRRITVDVKEYKYFMVNSNIYPIYDAVSNAFIKEKTWYAIQNNRISFDFLPFDFTSLSDAQNDCVYQCLNVTGPQPDQIFKLNITLCESIPLNNIELSKQYIALTATGGGAQNSHIFGLNFFDLSYRAITGGIGRVNSAIGLYSAASQSHIWAEGALLSDLPAVGNPIIKLVKRNGIITGGTSGFDLTAFVTDQYPVYIPNDVLSVLAVQEELLCFND